MSKKLPEEGSQEYYNEVFSHDLSIFLPSILISLAKKDPQENGKIRRAILESVKIHDNTEENFEKNITLLCRIWEICSITEASEIDDLATFCYRTISRNMPKEKSQEYYNNLFRNDFNATDKKPNTIRYHFFSTKDNLAEIDKIKIAIKETISISNDSEKIEKWLQSLEELAKKAERMLLFIKESSSKVAITQPSSPETTSEKKFILDPVPKGKRKSKQPDTKVANSEAAAAVQNDEIGKLGME